MKCLTSAAQWVFIIYLRLFLIPLHYGGVGRVVHGNPDLHTRKWQAYRPCGRETPDAELEPQQESLKHTSGTSRFHAEQGNILQKHGQKKLDIPQLL